MKMLIMKQKYLNIHDRIVIENVLNDSLSFKAIVKLLDKDCSTISKEIRKNLQVRCIDSFSHLFNNCINRKSCDKFNSIYYVPKIQKCAFYKAGCRSFWSDFTEEKCSKLNAFPYVCNSCSDKIRCTLTSIFIILFRLISLIITQRFVFVLPIKFI